MTNQELAQRQVSTIKASYSHTLTKYKTDIDTTFLNKSVDTKGFKHYIRQLIIGTNDKPIEDKSPATKRFLTSLDRQYNKDGVLMLVYNSMLKADGLGVI